MHQCQFSVFNLLSLLVYRAPPHNKSVRSFHLYYCNSPIQLAMLINLKEFLTIGVTFAAAKSASFPNLKHAYNGSK